MTSNTMFILLTTIEIAQLGFVKRHATLNPWHFSYSGMLPTPSKTGRFHADEGANIAHTRSETVRTTCEKKRADGDDVRTDARIGEKEARVLFITQTSATVCT